MKVSVIVPVFNPGHHFGRCVKSLLGQTMDDYEVIFADDGSSDGTEKRLDELAAAHERVRVLHLPPSGGPGRPRNVGVDAARGDYVYFLDDDDWLGPEALERMHAMAVRNDADIVIGKMVGQGRSVPRAMFRKSRDHADVLEHRLLGILTPHKLFRRAFLAEHGIRFPEGPVRLEDHRFVLTAYLRARTISVLADYPCCYWVRREGSYSRNRPDPAHYYHALRDVLDIVDEHVPPGPVRERFYAHWYNGKILKRLGERSVLDAPGEYRDAVYDEARKVVLERFDPAVDRRLRTRMRVRAALLRADAREELFQLLTAEAGVRLGAVLDDLRWDGDRLVVRFTARLVNRRGTPLKFENGRWRPPVSLPIDDAVLDITGESFRLDLYIRQRDDNVDYALPVTVTRVGEFAAVAEARVDRKPTPGLWDLVARLDAGGWTVESRLRGFVEIAGRGLITPYRTAQGSVSLRVRPDDEGPLKRTIRRISGVRYTMRRLLG